jgi:hypothetical protein
MNTFWLKSKLLDFLQKFEEAGRTFTISEATSPRNSAKNRESFLNAWSKIFLQETRKRDEGQPSFLKHKFPWKGSVCSPFFVGMNFAYINRTCYIIYETAKFLGSEPVSQ